MSAHAPFRTVTDAAPKYSDSMLMWKNYRKIHMLPQVIGKAMIIHSSRFYDASEEIQFPFHEI